MEKEELFFQVEIFMKVSMLMDKKKVLEYLGGQVDKNMKGITGLISHMDKEFIHLVMEILIKVNMWMG